MNQLSFKSVMPADAVLARYEVCRTNDLEEARHGAAKILCQNNLYNLDTTGSLNTRAVSNTECNTVSELMLDHYRSTPSRCV